VKKLYSIGTWVLCATVLGALDSSAQQSADKVEVAPEEMLRQQKAEIARQREEQQEYERQVRAVVPVDVHVVISRYQGEKKVSSLPYSLTVNAVHPAARVQVAQLRMGAQIPLPAMSTPTVDGKPVTGMLTTTPVQYKEIGTFIDASAKAIDAGAFELHVSVSDTSLYRRPPDAQSAESAEQVEAAGLPVLRTFTASNNMVLKDGQSKQFMLAADRVSSETLRVEVTLNVMK
jgi:hypothetical protein